jgi:outer membrane protein assembly factor BamB
MSTCHSATVPNARSRFLTKDPYLIPIVTRKPPYKIHPSNSYATESPVTDGQSVFAYFAAVGIVVCLDLEGEQVWTRELGAYKTGNDFGTGSSLALVDGKLFFQCDNEEKSFVCALNTRTGDDVYRVRPAHSRSRQTLLHCKMTLSIEFSEVQNWRPELEAAGGLGLPA